jgi:histidyl-tRNA synthetase
VRSGDGSQNGSNGDLLGANQEGDTSRQVLDALGVEYELDCAVKRGLGYHTEDGFEARAAKLGAQKQIAGGGRYAEGVGWAIGLDRLLLALE